MQWIITYTALSLAILAVLLGETPQAARAEGTLYFGANGTIHRVNPDGTGAAEVARGLGAGRMTVDRSHGKIYFTPLRKGHSRCWTV